MAIRQLFSTETLDPSGIVITPINNGVITTSLTHQPSLKKLMKGKTVIAIAHRLSTLKEMDLLVVMDKGKIVEQGSHDELLARKGAYYKFYLLQNFEQRDNK